MSTFCLEIIKQHKVLKVCQRKYYANESRFDTLAKAICVQDIAGEAHWLQYLKIKEHIILP